jgi:hypothetical protein
MALPGVADPTYLHARWFSFTEQGQNFTAKPLAERLVRQTVRPCVALVTTQVTVPLEPLPLVFTASTSRWFAAHFLTAQMCLAQSEVADWLAPRSALRWCQQSRDTHQVAALYLLHYTNRLLWEAEDQMRQVKTTRQRATTALRIAKLNDERSRLVNGIDQMVWDRYLRDIGDYGHNHPIAFSVGVLWDRLSVLALKAASVQARLAGQTSAGLVAELQATCETRRTYERQQKGIVQQICTQLGTFADGTCRPLAPRDVKMYRTRKART